jgi:RecQ family ATP-dependent DNA helicase
MRHVYNLITIQAKKMLENVGDEPKGVETPNDSIPSRKRSSRILYDSDKEEEQFSAKKPKLNESVLSSSNKKALITYHSSSIDNNTNTSSNTDIDGVIILSDEEIEDNDSSTLRKKQQETPLSDDYQTTEDYDWEWSPDERQQSINEQKYDVQYSLKSFSSSVEITDYRTLCQNYSNSLKEIINLLESDEHIKKNSKLDSIKQQIDFLDSVKDRLDSNFLSDPTAVIPIEDDVIPAIKGKGIISLPKIGSDSITDFSSRNYPWTENIERTLRQTFKLQSFRELQREAINATLSGRDVLVIMPTGGGKSLCYQLPASLSKGVTIVVSPLIALMDDQTSALSDLDIPAAFFSGDQTLKEARQMMDDTLNLKYKLVYTTPEKITKSKTFQKKLLELYNKGYLERFVVDEAHCVSTWGHDFRPDYRAISMIKRQLFPKTPTIALTATATQVVIEDIIKNLNFRDQHVIFKGSFNRPNIVYHVKPKGKHDVTIEDMVEWINKNYANESGIIYCLSKKDSEKVAEALTKKNISCVVYHAGLDNNLRQKNAQIWRQNKVKVIVATIAFGMGIDKPDVRFVIHHSFPKSIEDYYQASGRSGRDGKRSDCVLYYSPKDRTRNFNLTSPDSNSVISLNKIVSYCEATTCRRAILIQHFGEAFNEKDCNKGCDNCMDQGEIVSEDVTDDARNLLRVIKSTKGRYSLANCILIWRGSQNKKIKELKPDEIDGYKTGQKLKMELCNRISSQLLLSGYIDEERKDNVYGSWSLVAVNEKKAQKLLNGKEKFYLKTRMKKSDEKEKINTSKSSNYEQEIVEELEHE